MNDISKKVLIGSGIVEIEKDNIDIKELIRYINRVSHLLHLRNYNVETVSEEDIYSFFRFYPFFGEIVMRKICIHNLDEVTDRIKKTILKGINEDEKLLLRGIHKYTLPFIYKDQLIIYTFESTNSMYDELKNICIHDKASDSFIINLSELSEYNRSHINGLINNGNFLKKDELGLKDLAEYICEIDKLKNSKYNNIISTFKIRESMNEFIDECKMIYAYYDCALKNMGYISKCNTLKKILS